MTPSFGLALGLMFLGLIGGAPFGNPVFGAFVGLGVAVGIVWTLGDA